MDLSFVILSWNSERYIENCLRSIRIKCETEGILYEIIIIDNGSSDSTKHIVNNLPEPVFRHIMLVELTENKGTTYPRNIGLTKASGKFICILDSDTELKEGNLSDVLEKLERDDLIGIVAPKLLLPNGEVQNSVKRFPTFLQKLGKIPKAIFGLNSGDPDFYEGFSFSEETTVDTAISACWIFKQTLIDRVGYLDEKIFYSPEDLDYSMRVRKAGLQIAYYPRLEILHHTQQISHTRPFSKLSLTHFIGLIYYFRKHGGWIFNG